MKGRMTHFLTQFRPASRKGLLRSSAISLSLCVFSFSYAAFGQESDAQQTATGTNRALSLAADSPFRDEDLVYLEADNLASEDESGVLTIEGDVEGRYEDRTLRADKVIYDRQTGRLLASGNVTLIDAAGSIQYADRLELSDALETGTATNYTGRLESGGVVGARFVNRNSKEEFEFYNAYFTACELCQDGDKTKKPSWRLLAKRVRQDSETRTIRYNDAVLELLGIPVFYTPYLAHPDPSAKRVSGLLMPLIGLSTDKGLTLSTPYYWTVDDYTDLTLKPRLYTKVNPLLEYEASRRFHTGRIDVEGSFTYSSLFDRDGTAFDDASQFADPQNAPIGQEVRAHLFADGYFQPNETWDYGFGLQLVTDDNHLNRYDLNESPGTRGIYQSESRRNINQAFLVGQDNNTRLSLSTVAFQDLRSRFSRNSDGLLVFDEVDDSTLPIIAPKIDIESYVNDPVFGGRVKAYADMAWLTRDVGTDYGRFTAGLDYSKTFIGLGGFEFKPFGNARIEHFELEADGSDSTQFNRTLGQIGANLRYPLIKSTPAVDWIIEPRIQVTQSFGDGEFENFTALDGSGTAVNLIQDGNNVDLDQSLFWNNNKNAGFDLWEEGFRADVGGSLIADWGPSRVNLFIGQSYASGVDNLFGLNTGLSGNTSDIIGQIELNLGQRFSTKTRLSYDEEEGDLRRIDSSLRYKDKRFDASARYYSVQPESLNVINAPAKELSGSFGFKVTDAWSTRYTGYYDIDTNNFRRQRFSLAYQDDCTLIELTFTRNNISTDAVRDTSGFGIRIALLSFGDSGG